VKYRAVVIDPGHGGYDYGIFTQDSKEKDINLGIAKDLGMALQKKGVKVFPTRKVDQSLSLAERISFGNSKTPDLFLGIHATEYDRFTITTATAEEAGVDAAIRLFRLSSRQSRHIEESRAAAKAVADSIKADFKTEVLMRELPLPVLMSLDAPAMLIEYPLASQGTNDRKERDRLVNAVMKGLANNDQ
jgi:N-acetylmuramoyl-L-alanine amidase